MEEITFLVFGLGFFLYCIHIIERSSDKEYNRKLNEAREFGFDPEHPSRKRLRGK